MRRIARKAKWDRVNNGLIRELTEQGPNSTTIVKRRLHWYSHIMRLNPDRLTRRIFELGKKQKTKRKSRKT